MGTLVTRTKILIPRRREDLLSRPRLLRMLDDILDYPFTLISAPAGYGKTSLLIDLVHQTEYPVCWYSLDKMDQDPQRFLDHLVGCVQIRFPGFGETSARLVKDLPNPLDHSDQLITTLVNELYERISEHIVIILDDFHLVAENPQISSFISKFGQMTDDNIHLVLTSRNLFDFPDIPLLTGRRKIKGIGYDDLAFNEEEIKTLFSDVYKQTLTLEQTKHIAADTEGWITGLMLSEKHIKDHFPDQIKAALVTGSDIFNYLADQVFQKQPVEIKEFLLQSSIFDEFSQQLCSEVLGWPEEIMWDRLVRHLVQQNLFIQQVNDKELWIRYHNLFLDYLRENLKKSQPDQETILLTRLVDFYTQLSDWEKAFETAQRLDDSNALAQVIDKASSDLFHSGRIQLLSTWLGYLPEEIYESKPKMQALLGFTKTELGDPKDGLNHLVNASINTKVNLKPLDLAQSLNWVASANRMLSNHEQSLNNAISAYRLTANTDSSTIQFSESLRGIGLAYYSMGNLEESIKFLKSSLNSYKSLNNDKNIALVHMDIGSVYINQGVFHEARIHYQNALDIWTSLKNIHQLSNLLNNLGYLAILTGDYIDANTFLKQALSYSTETANLRMQGLIIASFGDLAFTIENFRKALEKYQESKYFSEKCNDGFLQIYLSLSITSTHRLLGNSRNAKKYLLFTRTNFRNNKINANFGLWNLEKGFHQIKSGSYLLGRISFRRAFNIFKKINKPIELAKVQAGQALLEIRAGKSTAALKYIHSASATIQEIGSNQPLLPVLSRHYDDFSKILNNTADPDLINLRTDLAEFRKRLPQLQREIFPEQTKKLQSKPALQIQAFGKTQLWVKGERLSVSEWVHQKTVRELFYYLLSQTEGVSKEEVGLVFWPDSSPRQLTKQFKNAIYRLRRSVGKDRILYDGVSRKYAFNSGLEYNYDVEEFLNYLEDAQQETHPDARLKYLQQAIKLYRHPFASDLDGVWAESIRRKLFLQYEKSALEVADILLIMGNFDESLKICNNLLFIEPCQEQAYQICFHTYHKIGDYTGLTRSYNSCASNLSHFLGIEPSMKTNDIYQTYANAKIKKR